MIGRHCSQRLKPQNGSSLFPDPEGSNKDGRKVKLTKKAYSPSGVFRIKKGNDFTKKEGVHNIFIDSKATNSNLIIKRFQASGRKLAASPSLSMFLKLEVLDLSHNFIKSVPPKLLDNLSQLKHINLSHNFLASIPKGFLTHQSQLESFAVAFNRLSSLASVSPVFSASTLITVDISFNLIPAMLLSCFEIVLENSLPGLEFLFMTQKLPLNQQQFFQDVKCSLEGRGRWLFPRIKRIDFIEISEFMDLKKLPSTKMHPQSFYFPCNKALEIDENTLELLALDLRYKHKENPEIYPLRLFHKMFKTPTYLIKSYN